MKQHIKDLIRKAIWAAGYEVIWRNEPGRNHLNDLEMLMGKESIETIFDVGAHHGESALEFRGRFPKSQVYCFEPSPDSYAKLADNSKTDCKIHAFQMALGDNAGKIRINRNSASATNSILTLTEKANQYVHGESIRTIDTCESDISTLDMFCEKQRIQKIDLLKVDTQGYELNVLNGASAFFQTKKVRAVFLEMVWAPIYVNQSSFESIFSFFRTHRYRFAGLYGVVRGSDRTLSWCDGLFIA